MAGCALLALAAGLLYARFAARAAYRFGAGLRQAVMASIAGALGEVLSHRAGESMAIGALFFSNQYGVLGQTAGAGDLLAIHQYKEEQP